MYEYIEQSFLNFLSNNFFTGFWILLGGNYF